MSAYERRYVAPAPNGYFTVADIAGLRNIDEGTVRMWIRSGNLPAKVESGKTPSPRYLIRKADYRQFTDSKMRPKKGGDRVANQLHYIIEYGQPRERSAVKLLIAEGYRIVRRRQTSQKGGAHHGN